jgi:CRISPR/Cas system-associated exonuclease Cas4 (RecB family)
MSIPSELILLLLILGLLIVVWDLFQRKSFSLKQSSGLSEHAELISLKDSSQLPAKTFFSEKLSLSSKPDALIKENKHIIPVIIKPFTNKVRDRHVIEIIVNLRLIEESSGSRPPYGIILIGKEQKVVKIKNTDDKQKWLDTILAEIQAILKQELTAKPSPTYYKCKNCDVRKLCRFSAFN